VASLAGAESVHFQFSTAILKRLGEELNPSPDQGIIELVKNAYDANAINCKVELVGTDAPGGIISISDDGDGMSVADIRDKWLVLGESDKSPQCPTRLGRLPAGSKGLGRLAALRMGSLAELKSRPTSNPAAEHYLKIDWEQYSKARLVEDVPLELLTRPSREGAAKGSEIVITGLRYRVGRMDVKRLARAVLLLADPFGDNPLGFHPTLAAPEFIDLENLVKKRYFEDADYHLIAKLDENGRAEARVLDWQGGDLFSAMHKEIAMKRRGGPYVCPPAQFDLWAFLLSKDSFGHRATSLQEVREWLKTFGGVHLYLNGLRVNPYGNPGNDWLDMNLRRAQIPEERPSTNTSIGRVSVLDKNSMLEQKTDRSGFIEGEGFSELREFARDALEWMGRRRLDAAMQRRAQERDTAYRGTIRRRESVQEAIAKAPPAARQELSSAFAAYERSREREIQSLRKEVQLYRTLSTAGITAATFAHESSGNPIKVVKNSIAAIERRGRRELGDRYDSSLMGPVEAIKRSANSLAVLGTATLRLIEHEKRRIGRVDINSVILEVLETFAPFFKGRDVAVRTNLYAGSPYLRGSKAAIESIITNLLNNSLAALERADSKVRLIEIHTEVDRNLATIRILDNGPGIEGIDKRDIWLPGETTQPNGTGLGLTIVRDAVRDLGGDVDAIEHSNLGGAEIQVRLPVLGV
jgi:signal transduction histidine kinase